MIRFLQTPGRTKKFFLSAMLVVICVAMVWYLVPQGNSSASAGQNDVLAKVGDNDITMGDLQRRAGGRPLIGPMIPQALDFFIDRDAESLEAHRLGFSVQDSELRDFLHQGQFGEELFPGGKYVGDDKYTQFVTGSFNMSVEQFETELKAQLLNEKLEKLVSTSVTATPQEIQKEFEKQNVKIKLEYAVVTPAIVASNIHASDAELKAYYDSHKANYANSIPEQRKAKYIVLDLAKVQASTPVSHDEIASFYGKHREEFRQKEEVKASHILVKLPTLPDGKPDPNGDAVARKKAEGLLAKVKGGADFAELAKKESDDKGSAINGGSLGFFQRGQMVPEFESAAFSLPKGGTSSLVKSQFGYHIIRVEGRHNAGIPPLEEVQAQIEPIVKQEKAQREAESQASALQTQARTQGIDAAAAKHELQVVTADWFSRADSLPGIGASADFMQAAFSATDKSAPTSVPTSQGYVIFQITAVRPTSTPTFEQIRSRVEGDYKAEQTARLLIAKTEQLSDRAHATHDLKKAAKEVGAEVKESEWLGQSSQAPDLGSMAGPASAAFDLKQGEISQPIAAGRNGAVLMVTDRQEASAVDLAKSQDQIRDQLLNRKRADFLKLFRASLVKRLQQEGKIRKNQQQIDAYARRSALS